MIDEQAKADLLESVNVSIKNSARQHVVLGSPDNISGITSVSSGQLRLNPSISKRFVLALAKSAELEAFEWHEIRCCLCEKIISFPCWYYSIQYAVNHFHYFVCFDKDSLNKPSTKCYRRS